MIEHIMLFNNIHVLIVAYMVFIALSFTCSPLAVAQPFIEINAGLMGVHDSSLSWGDYDNDGDLDLALAGYDGSNPVSKIYRNDGGGVFANIGASLVGIYRGSQAWGDYDNDGDLDLAIAGHMGSSGVSKVYRNDGGGVFTDIDAGLIVASYCSLSWGDYDNDGDLDLAIAAYLGVSDSSVSKIYRNDGDDVFTDINAGLIGAYNGSLSWGDCDNDGDLDLAIARSGTSKIYRNDGGGVFTDINASLVGIYYCSLSWGDCDIDGDLDLAIAGYLGSGSSVSMIYRNDGGGVFTDINADLIGVRYCSLAWGDYDNDGDTDLAITGSSMSSGSVSKIYRNNGGVFNTLPAAPGGLSSSTIGNDVAFSWSASTDNETPTNGLSYNLRVGTNPSDDDVFCGMADLSSGFRMTPTMGNVQKQLSWTIQGFQGGTYYWSVQAVDTAFAGSSWATEQSVTVLGPAITVKSPNRNETWGIESTHAIKWTWAGTIPNVRIELHRNGTWEDIEASTPNTGSYNWTVTGPFASDCLIRISDVANEVVADMSDSAFNISLFTDINADLTGVSVGSFSWGDYDSDGHLDLAIAGVYYDDSWKQVSKIYRNDGTGGFTDVNAGLTETSECSLAWGDYDNDGDLDLVLAGHSWSSGHDVSKIYRNDGGGEFVDINAGLMGVSDCSLAWGDYDNDGDLDLVVAGQDSKIYRNDGDGEFIDINAGLMEVEFCSLSWGDYDNDGDLDLAIAGLFTSKIYRNDGEDVFTDINIGLIGLYNGSLSWGDYDNDGDLDLALAGYDGSNRVSKVYRNDGGSVFTDINAGLMGVEFCSLSWGDYDNDGDLDLALAGYDGSNRVSMVYRNDGGGVFDEINAGLVGVNHCSLAWGDYDNDGDLDLAITGNSDSGQVSKIYRNGGNVFNMSPTTPDGLASSVVDNKVTFSWNAASDNETLVDGLSYNLRVGTNPDDDDVFSGMADLSTGLRRLPALGNAQKRLSWTLSFPVGGTYYWSVQAIDSALAGSVWAPEENVTFQWQGFIDIHADLIGVEGCSLAWGDYDNDGDLDLAMAGDSDEGPISKIYRNDGGGVFTDINAGLTGETGRSLAWGDYDNDGDLDLVIAGGGSKIYRNDGEDVFIDINANLTGIYGGSLSWGDYDNDGDLDLVIVAGRIYPPIIYRNDGNGIFTDINAGMMDPENFSVSWGDYDNDGDLDLAIARWNSKIYRNDGEGVFTDINADLTGVGGGSLSWGDYDNDGDLDLAIAGWDSKIYRNDGGGVFIDINANLTEVYGSSLAWGDYDNDGDLDLALAGYDGSNPVSKIYRNDGGNVFTDIIVNLRGVSGCSLSWGDYDNDGDLDLAIAGNSDSGFISKIYCNDGGMPNSPPTSPGGLFTCGAGNSAMFSWNVASDNETVVDGLSYNLRVGTHTVGDDIYCGMADLSSGWRRIPAMGNTQKKRSWTLKDLPNGTCYWSVQAIDTALSGSPWSPEQSFSLPLPSAPADFDDDGDVDLEDYYAFEACACGPGIPLNPGCEEKDFDSDNDVDQNDFAIFQRCYSGQDNLADSNCAN
ncbi:MAG: FG-GAP-like repeat-containing protein [Planctomycetota bacterium]|jgi:uncharacterized membrane protein YeaQ/YmgE (transglycosylase-associated protein family)